MKLKKLSLYSVSIALLTMASTAFAVDSADIKNYSDARVAIKYKGNVGDLAQKIAQKLNLGYYAYSADSTAKIAISQDNSHTLQNLFDNINKQLKSDNIRFDILNDKITLVLTSNAIKELNNPDYVGEIEFTTAPENNSNNTAESEEEVQFVSTPESATQAVEESIPEPQQDSAERQKAADKIQSILDVSKNKRLIAKYGRRKQPVYVSDNKDLVKLNSIKSTKISTFLVFDDDVDLSKYKIEGTFQDFAKLDNIAAILHRQKNPPKTITITAPNNKSIVLELTN